MHFLKSISVFFSAGVGRNVTGVRGYIISVIAVTMSIYQILSTVYFNAHPLFNRSIHLAFILALAALLFTPHSQSKGKDKPSWLDWIFAVAALGSGIYYISQIERIGTRWPLAHPLTVGDYIAGIIFVLLVLEITRRTMGPVLFGLSVVFILYALYGHHFTGILRHRQFEFREVLDHMVFTGNGLFSSPIAVASTFVFLFILFGVFFAQSGAGDFFFKFATALSGRSPGGGAKVAVVASALFGTISGSPVANTVTTGSFTIPMMKRTGYDPVFAGAIEAVASTGGSIMPPIMGTAAFLMVEMAGVPYRTIMLAGAVPALLYYLALMLMVHFRAVKRGLKPVEADKIPPLWPTLKEGFHFLIPLVVLVAMLFKGYTPSITAVAGIIAVVVVSWFRKDTRMGLKKIIHCLDVGARSAIVVSMACAAAGTIICGLMITGLSGKVASMVLSVGGDVQLIAFLITAFLCIILGMGMPVAAAYSLTASLAIPALYEFGVEAIPAHLFVVYFSIMSAITPPVAVAAYAASGISGANPTKIGYYAMRLGIVAFVVPFMFVYEPHLLLQVGKIDFNAVIAVLTAIIGVWGLSAALEGWYLIDLNMIKRIALFASGLLLMYPSTIISAIGFVVFALVMLAILVQRKKGNKEVKVAM